MSKADDILKKYGITPVRGSEGSSSKAAPTASNQKTTGTSSSKADSILAKYGITPVRGSEGGATVSLPSTSGAAQNWIDSSKSYLSDAEKYLSSWRKRDDNDEEYASLMKRNSSLIAEAYNWRNQYAEDDEAVSYINEVISALSNSRGSFKKYLDYYGQWETEDDYNKYVAYQKDYDEKSKYDLDAGQKEIEALEAELKELRKPAVPNTYANDRPYAVGQTSPASGYTTGSTMANGRPYAAGQQAQAQREEDPNDAKIRELEKQISQKKKYLNQAKHIQEGITLAGVVDNTDFKASSGYVSTYDDSRWAKLTGKEYDETYEYINNQNGIRDEIEQKHRNYGADNPFDDGESRFKEKGYDLLNENEIAIYNYYYAKEGKEKAQEYLDNIQETLSIRKATGMAENIKGNTALELAFGVVAGLDQWESGLKNAFNTKDDYIAQTAYQIASGMVREDLADDGFNFWYNFNDKEWQGTVLGNSVGQVAYDAITTSANMAPSILASTAIGLLNPTAGAAVGNALMGASAAGNAYQQALNEGYSKDQARGYSILVGGSEMVMEKLIGGISAFGGNALGKTLTKNVANADTALKMIAKRLGGSMISEFTEEYLQEVLDPVFSNIMLKTDEEVKIISAETIYSGILGALTAGIMEGPTAIGTEVKNYRTGKQLKAADISAARLAEIGKTFSADSVAYQLAGKVDENTGAYALGRLFNEIGATLTDQNKADIANALVEKNFDEITAKKNAEILAYVVEGGQLTDRQAALIEANTALAEVARTVLIDANSTVNQRTKGYNEALMALAKEKASPNTAQTKVAEAGKENTPASDKVDAQKENGSEGSSEVDTSPSQVSSITSIKNRTATIKLEDGSEVSVKDADLSPEDGVRIETIAKIDGISAADANAVLGILRAATGASAQMDSLGASEAYRYGYYGFSVDHMTKHGVFANSLTDSQRQAIYEVGQRARQQQIEKNTPKKADGTAKKTGIYFDDGNGNVVPYSESDMKVTEGKRSAGVKAAMVLRKLGIGGDIYFFESYVNGHGKRVYKDKNGVERPAPNGWYEKQDGSIHIDLNAGKNGEGYVLFTLAHELTHFIEQWSPQKYKVLADFLVENYEKGKSMDELVRAKQDKLSKNRGEKVSYSKAYSEVVADSMEAMLADGNVLDKLIELKAKDNALFTKMKQFFDNLVAKIRNAYKGLTPDSDEGKAVLEMTDSIEKIQQFFAEALVEASDNFQRAEKNTTEDGGVQYSFIGRAADGSGIYKTNYPLNTPKSVKQADLIELVQNVWSNKPITLTIVEDGRYVDITAKFNPELKERSDLSKIAFGNRKGRAAEQRMTLDLASDLYQIASEARFRYSKDATPKPNNPAHDGVTKYHYFLTNLVYKGNDGEYIKCHMNIDVKRNAEGDWFYSFAIEKGSVPQTLLAAVTEESATLPKDIIQNPDDVVKNESTESMDLEVDEETESVSPAVLMSERTWTESDYVQEREKAAKEIAKAIGVSEKKAKAYIDSVNSIAKMIADDRTRLDYFSSPYRSSFVSNAEYGGSFDFSTLCKKRRLLTGTFTAIQKALPNTALTANEILDIRNRMKKAGLEVSCGLCYVEGSRANMGQFAKEFLRLYKQYYPDAWQPNMADVNTPDGIEWVRINHPECYEQYEYFWNHYGTLKSGDKNLFASQQKPKLYQLHTEYKGEILKVFKGDEKVEEKNLNGGIRLQSFSDFEIVHLIDTMQIIMDMARVGLAGQAYTKVPDFAWALGDTGLKINLSLIAKGVDENGKLIFDDVEGMPIDTAVALRNRYSKNVGTILVAFNDEQLLAAMADDRVDFIIPFHRSQWKKSQYAAMGLPAKTKDYTFMQNEKFIKPQYHEYRGRMVKDKATNYMPNEYWDFSKSGKENAEAYLEMCARNNKRPKFYKLLQNNGDGSYSLKADGSTDGYWKLLIDFKMYDNDGNGSPQMAVKPEFNMTEANRMLNDYKGGHSQFPVAQGIVDEFVNEYKDSHEGVQFSDRDTESVSNRSLLANAFESVAQNDIERNRLQEYKSKIDLIESEERKLHELREQIKELSFAKGPKDTKKIRSLQFEANQAANRINTYDKQLLRLEASAPLQNVLNREKEQARKRAEKKGKEALEAYRERAAKTQRELLDRWQESRKRGIEGRQKTAMRHKIKDVVNELNQYLLKGTKDRHVPIGLQKAVAEALNAVNMDTVGAEERIAKLQAELMKAKTPDEIQEISKKIEHIREMGDRLDEKLKRLKTAYDEFINSDDPLIANSHDDAVSAHMMKLIVRVGDTPLREMTLDQLQDVYDVYKVVLATIRNANKSFKDNKNREISTRANQVMAEIDDLGVKRGKRPAFMSWIEKFGWDGLKPVYAMEHIGSQGLIDAYNNVRAGEDTWAKDIVEAREYYLEKFRKYKYDSWDFEKKHKFTSTTEMSFELTLDQIMSLYAYSKRDQAADHLKYGGIVFDPRTEVWVKTKTGIKLKYNVANATAYNISEETLADIIGTLTEDQKGFVDEMQTYLSDVMGAKGNEVSLAMYDVKLFREKHYFPLKSAHQYMAKAKEQAQGDVKIKNSGFSKETKPHAKNPIVLSSFMDVWSSHVNEMSMYHAFVLPMEDFYRIYNYTTPSKDETLPTEGVNASIENAYGSGATEYIERLLRDLNGGAKTDPATGVLNWLMGKFKKGAVFASLSVVVQQPSAIARAVALVDTKYFIGPKIDQKRHKALWEEVKQYAPVAIIKEMGYFDTNMGKSTKDYIMAEEHEGWLDLVKKLDVKGLGKNTKDFIFDSDYRDEVLSKAPAYADEIAWCGIWEAVKRETKANNPGMDVTSEEFLNKVGERFTEVIVKTQVYDSVLSRSALMRSKDTGLKMATAFMAEPTTSINMVADALLKGKRGNRKYARTAIGAVVASQILNSILVSFVYAARDDDEDETYWEKYIGSLIGGITDGLNPATYIPFIKDIVSITQGYDVERSDMSVVSDIFKAWEKLKNDDVSVYRKVEDFAGSIAKIFGIPLKNIMRDTRAFWQTIIQPIIDKQEGVERERTTGTGIKYAVKGAVPKWMGGGDVSNQQQLYEAIISGDKDQTARVKSRFKDQNAINSAIRKALRENDPRIHEAAIAWNANDLDEYMRIAKQIIAEKHFVQDDVVMAIRSEANELAPDDGETSTSKAKGLFTAEKFAEAISQGDQATAYAIKTDIIQTHQKNGKTAEEAEKSFNSSAKNDLKDMFIDGKISESKSVVTMVSFCDMDQEDAENLVAGWMFEKKNGFAYSDRVKAYKNGEVTESEMRTILAEFGGLTELEIDNNIKAYNWMKRNPQYDLTVSDALAYTKTIEKLGYSIEDSGIAPNTFVEYRELRSECEGIDSDGDGTADRNSEKNQVLEVINNLPITNEQKDALYYLNGWAASNLRKAPWH